MKVFANKTSHFVASWCRSPGSDLAKLDQLPRLGKKELICLLLFTCNYVVFVGEVSSSSGCLGWATLFYFIDLIILS